MPRGDGTGPRGTGPGQGGGQGMGGRRGMGGGRGGRGRMGGRALETVEECLCPQCGERSPHQRGTPCFEQKCPKCGTAMVGA